MSQERKGGKGWVEEEKANVSEMKAGFPGTVCLPGCVE